MIYTGIDIEDISRFDKKTLENDHKFLNRIFTKNELDYCFEQTNPAQHLTARFCAKEAAVKALSNLYDKMIPYSKIEVLKNDNKSVYINFLIEELNNFKTSLSISHEQSKAIAIVIIES